MLSISRISKSYEELPVLKDIDFSLQQGEKIGLIGSNGAGKSTLMKIIAGVITPDSGSIHVVNNGHVGYFPQEFTPEDRERTGREIIFSKDNFSGAMDKTELEGKCGSLELDSALLDLPIGKLSGGEKAKASLLRIMLSNADVFLLDEPTNNLDLQGITILEQFLARSKAACIIVSHDRAFLDKIITATVEIDENSHEARRYAGNYSEYESQKEKETAARSAEYKDYKEEKHHFEKLMKDSQIHQQSIAKNKGDKLRDNDKFALNFKLERQEFKVSNTVRLAERRLENLKEVQKVKRKLPLSVDFKEYERSGEIVFKIDGVTKKLGDKVFGPFNLVVHYGERLHIKGRNGSGKTTLLNLMQGIVMPDTGMITIGSRVHIGSLPQNTAFNSTDKKTALEFVLEQTDIDEGLLRRTLNRFSISDVDMKKDVSELSPGERARILIALIMTSKINCVILDEPSNHLDREVLLELEEALREFPGTLIVVSHDRAFMHNVGSTKEIVLTAQS